MAPRAKTLTNSDTVSKDGVVKSSRQALALGLGSMFNHSRRPNVAWERDISSLSIRYFALRDINGGEELCISYGPKLWFDDVDGPSEDTVENENDILNCQGNIFD
jgi:uncharacterized protein